MSHDSKRQLMRCLMIRSISHLGRGGQVPRLGIGAGISIPGTFALGGKYLAILRYAREEELGPPSIPGFVTPEKSEKGGKGAPPKDTI